MQEKTEEVEFFEVLANEIIVSLIKRDHDISPTDVTNGYLGLQMIIFWEDHMIIVKMSDNIIVTTDGIDFTHLHDLNDPDTTIENMVELICKNYNCR
jgi:hypothetical protein